MPFELPAKVAARLDRKASPAPKQAQTCAEAPIEIIPIAEWAEYRAAHPELAFTGKFDLAGRPIYSPAPISER